jgi:hypothetical protein
MTTKEKMIPSILIYVLGAALTYGYVYNRELRNNNERWPTLSNEGDAGVQGIFCSMVWPLYWPFYASRLMFEEGE